MINPLLVDVNFDIMLLVDTRPTSLTHTLLECKWTIACTEYLTSRLHLYEGMDIQLWLVQTSLTDIPLSEQ
jgi:hypothetical protein